MCMLVSLSHYMDMCVLVLMYALLTKSIVNYIAALVALIGFPLMNFAVADFTNLVFSFDKMENAYKKITAKVCIAAEYISYN